MEEKYKVYKMSTSGPYSGSALIAANDAEEANKYIDDFIARDKDNKLNSYSYHHVDEDDCIECLSSDESGIVENDIWYIG
jgi:hypothetical protein